MEVWGGGGGGGLAKVPLPFLFPVVLFPFRVEEEEKGV